MPLYIVSYDLRGSRDYQKLWDEMERLKGFKSLDSVYILKVSSPDAAALRDHFSQYIDRDDRLIVVEFSERPATRKAKTGTTEWLDANM